MTSSIVDLAKTCIQTAPVSENQPAQMANLRSWQKNAVSFVTFVVKGNVKTNNLKLNVKQMIPITKFVLTNPGKIMRMKIARNFVDFVETALIAKIS